MKEEKKEQEVVITPVTETEISDEELDNINGGHANPLPNNIFTLPNSK